MLANGTFWKPVFRGSHNICGPGLLKSRAALCMLPILPVGELGKIDGLVRLPSDQKTGIGKLSYECSKADY